MSRLGRANFIRVLTVCSTIRKKWRSRVRTALDMSPRPLLEAQKVGRNVPPTQNRPPSPESQRTMKKRTNIWVFVLSSPFYCRCPPTHTPPFSLACLNTHWQQTSRSERKRQHSMSLVSMELNCKGAVRPPTLHPDPHTAQQKLPDSRPPHHDSSCMSQPGSLLIFYSPLHAPRLGSHKPPPSHNDNSVVVEVIYFLNWIKRKKRNAQAFKLKGG